MRHKRFMLDVSMKCFIQRVVRHWNSEFVDAQSLGSS